MYSYPQFSPYYVNSQQNDERFGFLGPFILGGITGGLLAPAFYNKGGGYYPQQPMYYSQQSMYYPYPMGPCCRKF